MNKIRKLGYILLGVIIASTLFIGIRQYLAYKQEKNAEYTRMVETMYEYETYALCLDRAKYYKDFSYADVNLLTMDLAAYRYFNPTAPSLSIENIKDFLSNEFYENGDLRVLNQPDNIRKYIEWYVLEGGSDRTTEYHISLMNYKEGIEEYKNFDMYTTDDIEALNKLIEEFDNCPDKEMFEF
jgi:hypothetical protein